MNPLKCFVPAVLILFACGIVHAQTPSISRIGNCLTLLPLHGKYTEAGYLAKDSAGNDISNQVIVSGNIDTSKAGRYPINYCVTTGGQTICTSRIVLVSLVGRSGLNNTIYDSVTVPVGMSSDTVVKTINYFKNQLLQNTNQTGGATVDYNNVGQYILVYNMTDSFCGSLNLVITIKVADLKSPYIMLQGLDTACVELNTGFVDPWVQVGDNYWPPSTISVIRKGTVNTTHTGLYALTYVATDPSGNTDSVNRYVKVGDCSIKYEKGSPTISVLGACLLVQDIGKPYVEPGYVANDSANNDISNKVIISGTVNTAKDGRYELQYCITDGGITKFTKRVVLVSHLLGGVTNNEIYLKQFSIPVHSKRDTIVKFVNDSIVKPYGFIVATAPPILVDTAAIGLYVLRWQLADSICGTTLSIRLIVNVFEGTGVSALESPSEKILIYPNPANEFLNIESVAAIERVGIYDYRGKLVKEIIANNSGSSALSLNTIDFPVGIYLLQIKTSTQMFIKKIVISR